MFLEEISTYQKLKEVTKFLFIEDEREDNKFYLVQTEYGKLGISYYNLGIKPSIILKNKILFMGFGTSIIVYDIFKNEILFRSSDILHIVYELQYNEFFDCIICICELYILAFNNNGLLLWENGMQEVISDYIIKDKFIEIMFDDEDILKLSIYDGCVFQ